MRALLPLKWLSCHAFKLSISSASRWSSYTLFVRTSHLDSASGTGVVNTRLAICYSSEQDARTTRISSLLTLRFKCRTAMTNDQ